MAAAPDEVDPIPDPDGPLMQRVREGDQTAFRALIDRYWVPLVSYSAPMLGREDAAEDVVQETFIRVWRHRSEWAGRGTVQAYLYRITRNLTLNAQRDRASEVRRRDESARYSEPPPMVEPDAAMAARTMQQEVEAAVRKLPDRRREIFTLSRFHGLSYAQIADALGIAPQTVANQMKAALDELKGQLAHYLGED